jgi:hypothetical protein
LSRLNTLCRQASTSTNLLFLNPFEQALRDKTRIVIAPEQDDELSNDSDSDSYEEDLDDPVIVTSDEFAASMDRINSYPKRIIPDDDNRALYPLLFSATLDHEDVIMACARILDESYDVSLIREARNYLENVEVRKSAQI